MGTRISDIDGGPRGRSRSTAATEATLNGGRISRATLTTQLEGALRSDIVAGIHPPGEKLRAGDITSFYGVSATPIREALQRLSAEGLVTLDPKVGARVATVSLEDVRDVFAVRLALESRALELSIRHGDDAWLRDVAAALDGLRAVVRARSPRDATRSREILLRRVEAHRAFHWALLSASGSPWLLRFIAILHGHSSRYRMLFVRERDPGSWVRDHEAIVDAVNKRDLGRAVAELERHTRKGLEVLLRSFRSSAIGSSEVSLRRHGGNAKRS